MSSFGIGCQRFGGTVFPPLTAMFVRNSGRVPGDLLLQTKVFRGKSTTGALRVFEECGGGEGAARLQTSDEITSVQISTFLLEMTLTEPVCQGRSKGWHLNGFD